MTVLEFIQADKLLGDYSKDQIETYCGLRVVNPRTEMNESSLKGFELVKADMLSDLILQPNFSEGNLSIQYDRQSIKNWIASVATKYNDEKLLGNEALRIHDITDKW